MQQLLQANISAYSKSAAAAVQGRSSTHVKPPDRLNETSTSTVTLWSGQLCAMSSRAHDPNNPDCLTGPFGEVSQNFALHDASHHITLHRIASHRMCVPIAVLTRRKERAR
ncbi:MAG: hypothetical protein Q7T57_00095, partial [Dehalococcoidales bacterium]|nr:hypothetical protein [Dehalococcoidales bacterium]